MKIADMKVTELINEVGSGTPAPGGGAVAGLAGGVGVALTMMVNGLTLDKKGFENDRERLLDAIAKGNEAQGALHRRDEPRQRGLRCPDRISGPPEGRR